MWENKIVKPARGGFALVAILVVAALVIGIGGTVAYFKLSTKPSASPSPSATSQSPSSQITQTPTSDQTENWKVLRNNRGFQIKYPQNLQVRGAGIDVDEKTSNDIVISEDTLADPDYSKPMVKILIIEKETGVYKDTRLKDFASLNRQANIDNKDLNLKFVSEMKETKFAGVEAYTYEIEGSGFSGKWNGFPLFNGKHRVVEFEKDTKHFILIHTTPQMEKVVSTFHFLD